MLHDIVAATGSLSIQLLGADGQLKDQRDITNLVVTVGRNFIAARLVGVPAVMSHMALGSGQVAAVAADAALGTELGRVALGTATSAGNVATFVANFPAGTATGAITEAGTFNAATTGTLLCRTVFPVINKGAGDTVSVTWNVTIN